MIGIPEHTKNRFLVRIDNVEVEVSGYEMLHSEAAEEAALQRWKWLHNNLDSIDLVERSGDWLIYQIRYTLPEGQPKPNSARVAVCKLQA
ncbi:MAG TPA: hypothetical protein VGB07_36390 [Blastocatellia bacterium]